MTVLLRFFISICLLWGCGAKHISEPLQNANLLEKQASKDFVLLNPLTDDPDNPSPHNPLIKKYGDISEVRTYIRYKQKLGSGAPLTAAEAIALYTADLYLYPSRDTAEILKQLKDTQKRNETLGFPKDTPVLRYTGHTHHDFSRGTSRYYNVQTLPDGTRIINDHSLPDGKTVIPPKETSTDAETYDGKPTNTQETD